jgi:hypothetical protein
MRYIIPLVIVLVTIMGSLLCIGDVYILRYFDFRFVRVRGSEFREYWTENIRYRDVMGESSGNYLTMVTALNRAIAQLPHSIAELDKDFKVALNAVINDQKKVKNDSSHPIHLMKWNGIVKAWVEKEGKPSPFYDIDLQGKILLKTEIYHR